MEHALRSPVYLYQGELHLNAFELRCDQLTAPHPRSYLTYLFVFFLSRQFWALLPCQFMGLNAGLCSSLFAAIDEEYEPWEPGEESQPRSLRLT